MLSAEPCDGELPKSRPNFPTPLLAVLPPPPWTAANLFLAIHFSLKSKTLIFLSTKSTAVNWPPHDLPKSRPNFPTPTLGCPSPAAMDGGESVTRHRLLRDIESLNFEEYSRQLAPARSRRAAPSSSRETGSSGSATHMRQSVLYSVPRRSEGRKGQLVEPGSASTDLSKFKALSLNVTSESADRSDSVCSGKLLDDSPPPKFTNLRDALHSMCDAHMAARAKRKEKEANPEVAALEALVLQHGPDYWPAHWPSRFGGDSKVAREQGPPVLARGRRSKASREELVENGKRWMSEEAMVAFEKYKQRNDDLKEFECKFGELRHQCFSVENYYKIFHHFNFTIDMKPPTSADWISVLYFAEVKEMFALKHYVCYPLELDENGHCYACKNQGMDELRHPTVGGYDRGTEDTVFPYSCEEESDPEEIRPIMEESESDDDDSLWSAGLNSVA